MRPDNTTKGLPLPLSWLLQSAIYFQEKKEPRSFVQNGFGGHYAQESFSVEFRSSNIRNPP